jgi:hypothetical protein
MKKSMLLVTTLGIVAGVAVPFSARAEHIIVPPTPETVRVDAPNRVFAVGHAVGTQDYVCLPSSTATSGFAYSLFTPQATLFDNDGKERITHFFSPNPDEDGTIRPTWESSKDASKVWGKVVNGDASTDARFVAEGAIAWLKVTASGWEDGPNGGDRLSHTTFIQRLNTAGGSAPSTGCATLTDVGRTQFVPYTADYFFYH